MKNLMKACVLSMAMLMLMCGAAGADDFHPQGNALVSGLFQYYARDKVQSNSMIVLSNITSDDVQCKVTVYDQNGSDITTLGLVYAASSLISTGTGLFDIPAHSTRRFYLPGNAPEKFNVGYAIIEWSATDTTIRKALIGSVLHNRQNGDNSIGISDKDINGGQPF